MHNKEIQCLKVTFDAIHHVRTELALHASQGNDIKATECLTRLSNLYASIDAKELIQHINELEAQANVVKVDFRKIRIKKAE